jgi:site-specific recombinase XerD
VGRTTSRPWIREEVDRFEVYLRTEKRSENTVDQYGNTLEGFLDWVDKPPRDLTKADMQRWKGYLSERYCENTMSTRIAAVNQYAEKILERPDIKMRPPRRVFRTKIPLTEDEVSRILEEAGKPRVGKNGCPNNADASLRDHAVICLMYYGGLRASEVVNLRISDLDLEDKKLRVHEGKGKDYSMVNLSDEAVASLRAYLERGRPKSEKPEYADYLILSIRGCPMGRAHLWPQLKRIAFWAGIEKNVHPHIFRHSMITHMAEKGISASFIQAQSRHKSLDMVQRYTHLSQKSVRDAYDQTFAKKTTTDQKPLPIVVEDAQEQSASPRTSSSIREDEDRRTKALKLYLDGKIPEGTLEKLLSMLDGSGERAPSHIEGYA